MHYVALTDSPSDLDQGALHDLLTYCDKHVKDRAEDDDTTNTLSVYRRYLLGILVARLSSANICGFEQIQRMERGTIIKITLKGI